MLFVPHLPTDPGARALLHVSKVYWACIGFVAVWVALRALGVDPHRPPLPLWSLALVVAFASANQGLRSLVSLRRQAQSGAAAAAPPENRWGWVFTVIDLSLIAVGLRLTGGLESGLWLILIVAVVGETILAPKNEADLIRWGAAASLLAGVTPLPLRLGPHWLEIATRLFFLIAASSVTRRLRKNDKNKDAELAVLRVELAAAGERTRLSREIHDSVGNALAATVLRLEVAARVAEKDPAALSAGPASSSLLRDEAHALRAAMNQVRDWTFFARPWEATASPDPTVVWSEVLKREVGRLSQRTGMPVSLDNDALLNALPEAARVATLRIVQEALTNAAKYADSSQTTVTLAANGRWVEVVIADNGAGFLPESAGAGLGLSGMRERAEALGGTLSVQSAPGRGTRIAARLPATTGG